MIQVKEMMQDKDLKNSKSKDKGSRSRSQSMNEQSHYKQEKTKTRPKKAKLKHHIFNIGEDKIVITRVLGFHRFPDAEGDGFVSDSQTQLSFVNVDYSSCCGEEGSPQNDQDQLILAYPDGIFDGSINEFNAHSVFPYVKEDLLEPRLPLACRSWILGKKTDDRGASSSILLDSAPSGPSFLVTPLDWLVDVDCDGAGKGGGSQVRIPDLVVIAKVGASGSGISLFPIMERI
ncbi:hypothetical protein Tco_0784760 [Tanacetum coccineum]